MTKAEQAVKEALYELWYEYYTQPLTMENRIKLTEEFAEKWMDADKIKIDKAFIYHPMNRLKRRYDEPAITVAEVLADFILRAALVAERDEDYPILNAEGELKRAEKREELESGLFFDEIDEDAGQRKPNGTVMEAEAIAQLYTPRKQVGAATLTAELAHVKRYAAFYATSLAEEHNYDKGDVLRRIKALKLERIKECKVCGGAFYPRNVRREICDQQAGVLEGGVQTNESACELEYSRNYHAEYYQNVTKTG